VRAAGSAGRTNDVQAEPLSSEPAVCLAAMSRRTCRVVPGGTRGAAVASIGPRRAASVTSADDAACIGPEDRF
jgi:hypothetical protein